MSGFTIENAQGYAGVTTFILRLIIGHTARLQAFNGLTVNALPGR